MAGDADEGVGRPRPQVGRHIDPAFDRDIGSGSGLDHAEGKHVAGPSLQTRPHGDGLAIQCRRSGPSGEGEDAIIGKFECGSDVRGLQAGIALIITDEQIARTQRELVHRSRRWHADGIVPGAPQILHRRREATGGDIHVRVHWYSTSNRWLLTPCGSRRNSAGENSMSRCKYRKLPSSTWERV